jgi:uncharacterized protein
MELTYREGQFVWRELMTPDVAKARAFYGELLGWTSEEMAMASGPYTIFKKGDQMVAGGMAMPPDAAHPPSWMSYASIKDVDGALKAAAENGGQVVMPAMDVQMIGRFAAIADPTGGVVGLVCQEGGDGPAPGMPGPGTFCWETLNTTDIDRAKDFYTKVMGWKGGSGPGNMLVFTAGEAQVADVEAAPPGVPSHWLLHVVVDKLEAAREKAESLGAKVLMAEIPIPTVGRIAIITDPTGAAISLFEPAPPAAA